MFRRLLLWVALSFVVFSGIGLNFAQTIAGFLGGRFVAACGAGPVNHNGTDYFWPLVSTGLWFGVLCSLPLLAWVTLRPGALRSGIPAFVPLIALFAAAFGGIIYGYSMPEFYPHDWCGSDLAAASSPRAALAFITFSKWQLLLYELLFVVLVAAPMAWWFLRRSGTVGK